ncbi:bifunctional endoribonuclease/protein kinase ire1 [Entophlyctis luteolus]|nr:bifunctional endoribonuclease/protein kinase ire1 [Entophlyctis luteolus]
MSRPCTAAAVAPRNTPVAAAAAMPVPAIVCKMALAVLFLLVAALVSAEPLPGGALPQLSSASSPTSARSLQRQRVRVPSVAPSPPSFSASDLVVVATVDGSLHAVVRQTGVTAWTLADGWGALASVKENPEPPADGSGWISSDQERRAKSAAFSHPIIGPDGIIIPEPLGNGDLYYFTPGEDITKMPFSIKDIVARNSFVTDGNIAYSSKKVSRLLALDPMTGKIMHSFGIDDPWPEPSLDHPDREPIMISRTEYMLMIMDLSTRKIKWNITYGEFAPATLPADLFGEGGASSSKDVIVAPNIPQSVSVSSSVDGGVVIDDSANENAWEMTFETPVLAAFSVRTKGSPSVPLQLEKISLASAISSNKGAGQRKTIGDSGKVFVGLVGDSYYILTRENSQVNGIADTLLLDASPQQQPTGSQTDLPKGDVPSTRATPLTGIHKVPVTPTPTPVGAPVRPSLPYRTPPTPEEWHEFFHVSGGWRFIERLLGFTDRTEELFVYMTTVLVLSALGAAGWGLTHLSGGKEVRRIVKKLSLEVCGDVLANATDTKSLMAEEIEMREIEEQKRNATSALRKEDPFNVLDKILMEAKELPALPDSAVNEAWREMELIGEFTVGKTVSSVHKVAALAAGKRKRLGKGKGFPEVARVGSGMSSSSGGAKDTRIEVLSDSNTGDEEENQLDLANMDQLISNEPNLRFNSDLTANNQNESTVVDDVQDSEVLKTMTVSDQVLGHGSHGTMVFKGTFEGRPVAVKRLLLDFYDVAYHEVKILQDSDIHQNVVRYFFQETTEKFMYIALELCPASLADVIENTTSQEIASIRQILKPRNVLLQITSGIQYLHSLKLVHRDIKPQNILIGESKGKLASHPRILISDFGLCKRLAEDQSSFHNTIHTAGGTIGWRAPECLVNQKPEVANTDAEETSSQWVLLSPSAKMRITKSIDVFSSGCVFYYYLTGGIHPFGDKFTREMNILKGNHRLDRLDAVPDGGAEAKDLIRRMLFKDPKKRPDTQKILAHPYFWTTTQKLTFLQDVSDRLESEVREPPSGILKQLERGGEKMIGGKSWAAKIDRRILDDVRSFRQYDVTSVQDLLRVMRNKKHHYQELSADLKKTVGALPDGFYSYFSDRFPGLLMHVYHMVAENKGLKSEAVFTVYFDSVA